ncbi:MAG TPA: Ig-like domain-containing protein, partial [Pirellulaceae bacterium]|nr:Ig-like domain-containing protein [Pirellulaceae bacterium]
ITAVANGLTRLATALVLPSPLTQPNRPPNLLAPLAVTVNEGQALTVPLIANDLDPLDTVQVTVSGAAFASITSVLNAFQLRLTPGGNTAGKYTLTLRATDSRNAITQQTISLTVRSNTGNRAPVLTVPGTQTVAENQLLSFTVSATDADTNQTLTYSAGNLPTGASFNAATRQFTWTPSFTQAGNYLVSFTATDNGVPNLSDTKIVAINVTNVNRPPVATAQTLTTAEDTPRAITLRPWCVAFDEPAPCVALACESRPASRCA